jgi:threonine dehydratase
MLRMAAPPPALTSIDLSAIIDANQTIAPYIRRTPFMYALLETRMGIRVDFGLKLENLQVGGSTQVRGLLNAVLHAPEDSIERGIVTVRFGGEHYAAAAAYVAGLLEVTVSVYVSRLTTDERLAMFQAPRMHTYINGESWESAARYAETQAQKRGQVFLHPFADPLIVSGLWNCWA